MDNYSIPNLLLEIEQEQCKLLSDLTFSEHVRYIYNPLYYAKETHEFYVRTYCNGQKIVLFLGMNPGPFGMAQNGVPFGDSAYVNNWLKIMGNVFKPDEEHPKRKIEGLNCSRSEVSGSRFWSFMEDVCGTPENLFKNCYVHNYCPFSMMTESAKNITPADLKAQEKKALLQICDEALYKIIMLLQVKIIVGIGKFAEVRAKKVVNTYNIPDITIINIMHPSPINPAANKGWKDIVYAELEKSGILKYMT
ncbi:single-strand selective monofunctional uracil DNA glycosylase-like [Argiope bruennichi]|uniref:Single-strand selective monofunctional uracil like protein n=1 Tax=Argiope bruennichi TaxID=94029 RepID=A0A8T0G1E5_ARGBR|nr:single-strand selective monofunctional uracil DNA glycosylase-like [Argiope bruennichi]KAF8796792.1 Single-strand selective monofunctional uracil like protein [Argiope bruennichi]